MIYIMGKDYGYDGCTVHGYTSNPEIASTWLKAGSGFGHNVVWLCEKEGLSDDGNDLDAVRSLPAPPRSE